jgi:hypothetical protein
MYQYGNVDALTLKEVLGHASTSTTEIYTHLSNQILKHATDSSPLAHFERNSQSQAEQENNEDHELKSENTDIITNPE